MQDDLIRSAIKIFEEIESYTCIIESFGNDEEEKIRYAYKKPGLIRMDFINPHSGASLIYNPNTKKVRLKPSGFFSFLTLTLNPSSNIIKSPKGHTVDESDIGALLTNVHKLQLNGNTEILGKEKLSERECIIVGITGEQEVTVNDIHRYILWLDIEIFLPLKVEAFDRSGALEEGILIDSLKINVQLPEDYFEL